MIVKTKAVTYYYNVLSEEDEQRVRDYAEEKFITLEEAIEELIGIEIDFIDSWTHEVIDESVVEVLEKRI